MVSVKSVKSVLCVVGLILSNNVGADFTNVLYGDFRFSAGLINRDDVSNDGLQANNNASRIGLKGSVGTNDLKAIYHLQAGARNDTSGSGFTSRFFFAGIKSFLGSVIYGRHSTPYKMAGLRVDPFYDTSAGLSNGGATYGLSAMTNGFSNNALSYITPTLFGGFSANAAIYIDDSSSNKHDSIFGFQYKSQGITAGVQHAIIGDGTKTSSSAGIANSQGLDASTRLYAGYETETWSLKGSYEFQVANELNSTDVDLVYISGTYKAIKDLMLAASVGVVQDGANEGVGWQTGVFYNILPKTQIYGLYSATYLDQNDDDRDALILGVSHKFALSH